MTVTVNNIHMFVGGTYKLLSIPKDSYHYGESYMEDILGEPITILDNLGTVKTERWGNMSIKYGFEIEPINKKPTD